MQVRVRLKGALQRYRPPSAEGDTVELELTDGLTVADAMARLGIPSDELVSATHAGSTLAVEDEIKEGWEIDLSLQ